MNILLDVDDVLLEWRKGFEEYLIKSLPITYKKIIDGYETIDVALLTGDTIVMSPALEFNEILEFSQLKPIDNAVKYVRQLHEDGFKMSCITACGTKKITRKLRKYNLDRYFGDIFENIEHVNIGETKRYILQQYKKAFWVEDNLLNCMIGESIGHIPILMNKPYNQSNDDVIRVDNWQEIYGVIKGLTN